MTDIIQEISDFIEAWNNQGNSPDLVQKNWGFCELITKGFQNSDQPFPVPITGSHDRGTRIALDDRYDFISWIRIPGIVETRLSEEDSWGLDEGKRQVLNLRVVIAHKVELGEDLIVNLVHAIPEKMELSGYDFVHISANGSIDFDHETIYRTELGETKYEIHRLAWNLYVINLAIEYLFCPPNTEIPITDDDEEPITV